jgi:hypothetical protein
MVLIEGTIGNTGIICPGVFHLSGNRVRSSSSGPGVFSTIRRRNCPSLAIIISVIPKPIPVVVAVSVTSPIRIIPVPVWIIAVIRITPGIRIIPGIGITETIVTPSVSKAKGIGRSPEGGTPGVPEIDVNIRGRSTRRRSGIGRSGIILVVIVQSAVITIKSFDSCCIGIAAVILI